MNDKKVGEFKRIMDHIVDQEIPFYMTYMLESGEEAIIRGYNPNTKIEIGNLDFILKIED